MMYLNKSPRKNGRVYLSCVHGFWDGNKKRTKTIKSFGYVDELEEKISDPVAHFTAVVAEMEALRKKEASPVTITVNPTEALSGKRLRKNLGFAALSFIYHELGLGGLFTREGKKTKSQFNLNQIVKLLVYERILHPGSKRAAILNKDRYFEKFSFSEDGLYRALDEIAACAERVQLYLHKQVSRLLGRDTELLYYDVTNYYFESDVTCNLRKKGVSKEHRPDKVVQMGLLIDDQGLPVSFELFAGNTNDCKTFLPAISKVKNTYGIGRVIVIADKGINSSDNCAYNLIKKDGYVFSASVRKADKDIKAWCLDRQGYRWEYTDADRAIKSRVTTRNLYLEGPDGKKKPIPVRERHVAVWSRKYAKRAAKKRAEAITKAKGFIKNPSSYTASISYGAAKYIKGLSVDKKSGEILECAKALSLDIDRIEAEARFDGFYLIVTSELNKAASDIITLYSGLAKIEESFKVTKTYLKTRPVYVWTDAHIKAHFLICFIALLIIRILEIKTEHKHSIAALIDAMKSASATNVESNWWIFDYRNDVLDDIGKACKIDFSKRYLPLSKIKSIIGDTKK
jgi:transposase